MSWLFGIISPNVANIGLQRYQTVHDAHLYQNVKDGCYYFACGGNVQTCFSAKNPEADSFWIGLGIIIENDNGQSIIYSHADWERVARKTDLLQANNGHFVLLTYVKDTFEIRTDTLGLRTLYWYQHEDEIVISTRIDWITKYLKGSTIDYRHAGTRWLLFNQLSYHSLVKGIHRLGPNGKLSIHHNRIDQHREPFTPSFRNNCSQQDAVDCLRSLVSPILIEQQVTLGLSGGLDSRVLLSLLLGSDTKTFQTHTFGNVLDPDVYIPKRIAMEMHFTNVTLNVSMSSPQELLPVLQHYAAETNLIEPISTVLRLQNVSSLDPDKFTMLDGGYGEIARRQYLNKLALNGEGPFRDHNIELILKNLRFNRGHFFSREIVRQMEEGTRDEISLMLSEMPAVGEIGLENYLDLWSVRTRFPNFGSDEQARLDNLIRNYMPFAQLSFVNLVFSMPISFRKNGRLFREIIKTNCAPLSKYSLVKSGTTYPFPFSTKTSWLFTKIKSKAGYQYSEHHNDLFLEMMKEYIFDLLLSKNVREYPAYNYDRIRTSIEQYYDGKKDFKDEIIWWLTFELWRRAIEQK